MREGWTPTRVSSLLTRSIGGVWGAEPGTDQEEVTVVRSTEFTKNGILNFATGVTRSIKSSQLSSRELAEGDILLEKSGGGPEQPVGRVVYVHSTIPTRYVCSNFIQLLTPSKEKVLPRFLFLVMWQWHFENKTLEYQAQTTGIRNLRTPDYLEQLIALPPLVEQRRIVDLIAAVDSYIAALQQQADAARSARSAVLSELLSAGGDDWTETTLGEVAELNPEATKNFHADRVIRYIDLASVSHEAGISPNLTEVEYGDAPGRARRVVRATDVLVSTVRPYLKGFAQVPEHLDGEVASTGFAVVRAKPETTLAGFVWALVGTADFVLHLMDRATGSSYPAVRPEDIASYTLMLPPIKQQRRIVEIISSMDELIQSADKAVADAKSLRSGLLSDLLSGDHEIPESYDRLLGAA